ncbi:universal stress protein [Paracrocinitomix mangrovi]|uniref:universal stress protein n=1 Tax=Paracrocinitomix mangrovi TaxID=2862509 RepID=UPI001C8EB89D|nr:universal stress protein [Paracrocinitomix mangrovi]UKN01482.1 universal stress protein [Paracrocinitomix mangrovi]
MSTETTSKKSFSHVILMTDFSGPARNAIKYAIDAFGPDVEYNLLNAYYARSSSATLLDLNDILAKESMEGLDQELAWIKETYPNMNLNVKMHSVFGSPVDAIKKMRQAGDYDIVIMGTKGASGMDAVLFGSVASAIIRATVIPVISIPPSFSFGGFKEVVLATDGKHEYSDQVIAPLQKMQKQFGSQINVFSVETEGSSVDLASLSINVENAHYSKVESNDVTEAITDFCDDKNADLLVILPIHTGFFDRLFHSSVSKALVEKAKFPILALEHD